MKVVIKLFFFYLSIIHSAFNGGFSFVWAGGTVIFQLKAAMQVNPAHSETLDESVKLLVLRTRK